MRRRNNGRIHVWKQFVVSRVSGSTLEYADRFYKASGGKKVRYFLKESFRNFSKVWGILTNRYAFIYHVDFVMTTKCSLRCRDCSNLMQYYTNPENIEFETIKRSIRRLLDVVDEISTLTILGGEPLLYPDITKIIELLLGKEKIKRIRIITNGTLLIKDEKLLELLKQPKMYVYISNYGKLSRRKDELIDIFKEENIEHYITKEEVLWSNCGTLDQKKRTEQELERQFEKCASDCLSLFKGELHYCPRSAHGTDLGYIPKRNGDYVDLLEEKPYRRMREELFRLINRKPQYILPCDYCDKGTKHMTPIPAAVQVKHE